MATVLRRRLPQQKRSRDRYNKVLAAARELIALRGNDGVSMREIADAADMPIASVYQYFPDKNGLLWALISDVFDLLEGQWNESLVVAMNIDDLNSATLSLFDSFVNHCESDPSFSRLWTSAQANTVLTELDHAFNIRIADAYCDKLLSLYPDQDRNRIWHQTLLMASLSSTALQLAFEHDSSREQILDEFRAMIRQQSVGAS